VVSCLYIQPALGILHHRVYKNVEKKRSIWAILHVWWGRIIVTLAIINGGLGLELSGNTTSGEIAYGVIAGFIWVVWMGLAASSHVASRRTRGEAEEKIGKRELDDANGVKHNVATNGTA